MFKQINGGVTAAKGFLAAGAEANVKYKNRKDNDSMMAMNAETQAVYAKYGVSPSGSCVQLLIQILREL